MTISISDTQHNTLYDIMLSVIVLWVAIYILLWSMLSVVMLNAVMLNVVAP
jgi:hypothetical protein